MPKNDLISLPETIPEDKKVLCGPVRCLCGPVRFLIGPQRKAESSLSSNM